MKLYHTTLSNSADGTHNGYAARSLDKCRDWLKSFEYEAGDLADVVCYEIDGTPGEIAVAACKIGMLTGDGVEVTESDSAAQCKIAGRWNWDGTRLTKE